MKKPEKLSNDVVNLLLERLADEFTAFYFYRAASNWCKNVGFFKAATFFANESDSEMKHAKGIEDYLVDWNIIPALAPIAKPPVEFKGLSDVISKSYEIEYDLYEEYEDTSMKIFKIGDLCVFDFLQEYRKIQKDSVAEYSDMINILDGIDVEDKYKMLRLEEDLFE